jgi:glycosyl transferase family 87
MTQRSIARYKGVSIAAVALVVVGCAIGIVVPAGLGWDFANFYDAGHRIAAGQSQDLYAQERPIAGQPPQGRMRFWGAPLSAALFAPLSRFPPETALIAFKVQNTIALFLGLWLLYRHCRRFVGDAPTDRWAFTATFAVMCLLYQPFWTIFRVGGQTTPTVFLLVVGALLLHTASRVHLSAVLLATAALIKPGLAPMLLFLACASGWMGAFAIAGALGVYGIVSIGVLGWPIHQEFLAVVAEGGQFSRGWTVNSSLYVLLENFRFYGVVGPDGTFSGQTLAALTWTLKLGVVAAFVAVMRRSRWLTWPLRARRHFEFLMALLFWLCVSQIVWEHYLALLFIPLVYFVATAQLIPQQARRMLTAIFILCLGQNLVLMEFLWNRIDVASMPVMIVAGALKAGPLIVMLAMLWRHHAAIFRTYRQDVWTPARWEWPFDSVTRVHPIERVPAQGTLQIT